MLVYRGNITLTNESKGQTASNEALTLILPDHLQINAVVHTYWKWTRERGVQDVPYKSVSNINQETLAVGSLAFAYKTQDLVYTVEIASVNASAIPSQLNLTFKYKNNANDEDDTTVAVTVDLAFSSDLIRFSSSRVYVGQFNGQGQVASKGELLVVVSPLRLDSGDDILFYWRTQSGNSDVQAKVDDVEETSNGIDFRAKPTGPRAQSGRIDGSVDEVAASLLLTFEDGSSLVVGQQTRIIARDVGTATRLLNDTDQPVLSVLTEYPHGDRTRLLAGAAFATTSLAVLPLLLASGVKYQNSSQKDSTVFAFGQQSVPPFDAFYKLRGSALGLLHPAQPGVDGRLSVLHRGLSTGLQPQRVQNFATIFKTIPVGNDIQVKSFTSGALEDNGGVPYKISDFPEKDYSTVVRYKFDGRVPNIETYVLYDVQGFVPLAGEGESYDSLASVPFEDGAILVTNKDASQVTVYTTLVGHKDQRATKGRSAADDGLFRFDASVTSLLVINAARDISTAGTTGFTYDIATLSEKKQSHRLLVLKNARLTNMSSKLSGRNYGKVEQASSVTKKIEENVTSEIAPTRYLAYEWQSGDQRLRAFDKDRLKGVTVVEAPDSNVYLPLNEWFPLQRLVPSQG